MCLPAPEWYAMLGPLVALALSTSHHAVVPAVTGLVGALLAAQSLHPADLARAWPQLETKRARQALRRVRRHLKRRWLRSTWLTPQLVRVALRLLPPRAEVVLVLDSTRCGRWELFTVGVRWRGHHRVLPIAWTVLAYPWRPKQVTPAVIALLERAFRGWPPERAAHLVADRGFPSLELFRCLARLRQRFRLGYTIRLRAGDYVRLPDGACRPVGTWMRGVQPGEWTVQAAAYRKQEQVGPASWLHVGRGPAVVPVHQAGPADQRRRERRAREREAYLRRKRQPGALETDHVWALLSTEAEPALAVTRYAQRFSTEPTYRDLNTWDLEAVVRDEPDGQVVDGLVGLSAIAYLLQVALGVAAGQTTDPVAGARQQQWSTTDRLSAFWRGRQALHAHAHDWRGWLTLTLAELWLQLDPAGALAQLAAPATDPLGDQEAA